MVDVSNTKSKRAVFSNYEWFVIVLMAFIQFTVIVDFMILSPIGAILMPTLRITPREFSFLVAVYGFSAAAAGLCNAGFADRFERKKLLLFFYCGFAVGTLFCGLAKSYTVLFVARLVTGAFGGVIGATVYSITTDLFSFDRRGRVQAFVQTGFATSQVLGIPGGLLIANAWGWQAPFLALFIICLATSLVIYFYLHPIARASPDLTPHNDASFYQIIKTAVNVRYTVAFATIALLTAGSFMMMPFATAFSVNNLGIAVQDLPILFISTGLATILAAPFLGKAADFCGKFEVFVFGTLLAASMIFIYTKLEKPSFGIVLVNNILMFLGISARMIASYALVSMIPSPHQRGLFMSLGNSVQQIAGGGAALLGGYIINQTVDGRIENYDMLGYWVIGTGMITILTMHYLQSVAIRSKET
jgi:predicted MFS family arabinose efflux permease